MLARTRIILVSPSGATNVGSVCRVMANMGLSQLVVVAPRCDVRDPQAVAYAAHGDAVLHNLTIVNDLRTALAGCVRAYATSSKLGMYRRQAAVTPRAAAAEAAALLGSGEVAFVFGREDYGLLTTELLEFDRVVTIPADPAYPVLNLAASVTILCYELRLAVEEAAGRPPLPTQIRLDLAPADRKQILFDRLYDALDRVGFFFGQSPDHLKYALRHMFGRMDLTVNEADILLGMARQIRWYVDHYPRDPRDGGASGPIK